MSRNMWYESDAQVLQSFAAMPCRSGTVNCCSLLPMPSCSVLNAGSPLPVHWDKQLSFSQGHAPNYDSNNRIAYLYESVVFRTVKQLNAAIF